MIKPLNRSFSFHFVLLILPVLFSIKLNGQVDTSRVRSLLKEAGEISFENKEKALENLQQAKAILTHSKFDRMLAETYYSLGMFYHDHMVNDSSIYYTKRSIPIFKKHNWQFKVMKSYNLLGNAFTSAGSHAQALENYLVALDIARKIKDERMEAGVYNNIGNVYGKQANQKRAIEYYLQSAAMNKKAGRKDWLAYNYDNLAVAYGDLKNNTEALKYAKMAAVLSAELGDEVQLADNYSNLLIKFAAVNKRDSAAYYGRQALYLFKKNGYEEGIARSQVNWAEFISERDPDSALYYAQQSLKGGLALKSLNIQQSAYACLSKIYARKGNYKNAYDSYKKFILVKDSTQNAERIAETAGMEASFRYAQQQKEDSLQRASEKFEEQVLTRQKEERQAYIRYSLLVVIVLLTCFGIYVFINFRRKTKLSKDIQAQKELVEEKQKEIIDSINYAQRIQHAILANETEIKKYFPESFLFYRPKDIVAGDFYFFETTATHVFYAAADCTGHGVPGALVSVVCSNALSRCVKEFGLSDPGKILDQARELVLDTFKKSNQDVKDGMDISLLAKDLRTGNYTWAGANNPLWYTHDNQLVEIAPDKQPIGLQEMPRPFTTHQLSLSKGDQVILFTDGFADQFGGEKGKKLKYSTFKNVLMEKIQSSPGEQLQHLDTSFVQWKGPYEQTDDVCVIGIKI